MDKIVVACDSFKGSLSSDAVAEAVENGIRTVFPACRVIRIPVADGGEGTVGCLIAACGGKWVTCESHDPLMRPLQTVYGISADGTTAYIETAAASGLPLLAPEERDPLRTNTYGTGELIADALQRGCRQIVLGIGGSATNDAGTGLLQALGLRFFDRTGKLLHPCGASLERIATIDETGLDPLLRHCTLQVICDVDNPFYGPEGAAHVFARQKGADNTAVGRLDDGLRHFAALLKQTKGTDLNRLPGAGAAGGVGGAMAAFLNARLQSGTETLLQLLDFDRVIAGADLIFSGEGRIDGQTLRGKTVSGILKAAGRQKVPVILLGGAVERAEALTDAGACAVFPIQPAPVTPKEAMAPGFACRQIERTVTQILQVIDRFGSPQPNCEP